MSRNVPMGENLPMSQNLQTWTWTVDPAGKDGTLQSFVWLTAVCYLAGAVLLLGATAWNLSVTAGVVGGALLLAGLALSATVIGRILMQRGRTA